LKEFTGGVITLKNVYRFLGFLFCFSAVSIAAEFPQAEITNGGIRATLYLPNQESGYYRGGRFDWSGVIARLEYAGHNYFGVWFPKYEPTLHDAITGPVDEFRSQDGGLGYGEAQPGDFFVKIGVGVLRKLDNEPYQFARNYPIIDHGKWIVRPGKDRVEFVQELTGVRGYKYVYSKTVRLASGKPELILEHSLKNTGKRVIETEVYNHDFYVIDGQPTGPDFQVKFPFQAKATDDLKGLAEVRSNDLVYLRELRDTPRESAATYIQGYSSDVKDNDIRVENSKVKAGVRETGGHPLSKLYFWSIRSTVCPEAYIALRVAPGKKVSWRIRYQFYTLP
jgi:hypothetical protein